MKMFNGIHPTYSKITEKKEIEIAKLPGKVILPLQQHTGAICEPLVKLGDKVKVGQKIAESKEFVSAPIHSSISGEVIAIEDFQHPTGAIVKSIIIASDNKINWYEGIKKRDNVENLTKEELLGIIKEAGIVGLGGAAFPTHVKLKTDKKIDYVILNGAECEPYITADYRLMLETPNKLINGLKLIMKALGAEKALIGIEDNKQDAINTISEKIKDIPNIKVVSLKAEYPQGAEKMLIYTMLGRKVPPGKLPLDVGVVVNNVSTAKAIYDAVYDGKPLIERVITVTGAVKEPENLLVKLGTTFKDIIEQCGGYTTDIGKLIMGGPLMGITQKTDLVPIVKATNCILVLDQKELSFYDEEPCIRCSECVNVCPMQLVPTSIASYSKKNMFDMAEKYFALDCFECGCCAYVCPSKIPLVQYIKKAKAELMKK